MKVVILRKKKKSNITARMNAKIQHVDKGIKKVNTSNESQNTVPEYD